MDGEHTAKKMPFIIGSIGFKVVTILAISASGFERRSAMRELLVPDPHKSMFA